MAEDHLSTQDAVENNEVITKSDTNLSQRLEETLNNIDNSVKELEDSIGKLDVQNQSSTNKIKQLSESRERKDNDDNNSNNNSNTSIKSKNNVNSNNDDESKELNDNEKRQICRNEKIASGFSFESLNDYEKTDKIQLSEYYSGIPRGLEGLKQELINKDGLQIEGIFRLRGNELKLNEAKELLKNGAIAVKDIDCTAIEIAQLIKAWFREIHVEEPGWLTQKLLDTNDESDVLREFDVLYEPRRSILLWTIDFWLEIEKCSDKNKMLVSTLAIVFSPNMVRCNDTENPMTFLTLQKRAQIVLTQLASLRKQNLISNDKKNEYKKLFDEKKNAVSVEYVRSMKSSNNNNNGNGNGKNLKDRCIVQ